MVDGTSALLYLFGVNNAAQRTPAWGSPPAGFTPRTTGSVLTYSCTKDVTDSDGSITIPNGLIAAGAPANMAFRGAVIEVRQH